MKITSQFKTKLDKNDKAPKTTVVTYTFPSTMPQPLISGWVDSANIRLQAQYRRSKKVPQSVQIDALEFASSTGGRSVQVTKESVTAMMSTFTPAQLQQMLKDSQKKEADEAKAKEPKVAKRKNKPHPQAKPSGTTVPAQPQAPKSDGDQANA